MLTASRHLLLNRRNSISHAIAPPILDKSDLPNPRNLLARKTDCFLYTNSRLLPPSRLPLRSSEYIPISTRISNAFKNDVLLSRSTKPSPRFSCKLNSDQKSDVPVFGSNHTDDHSKSFKLSNVSTCSSQSNVVHESTIRKSSHNPSISRRTSDYHISKAKYPSIKELNDYPRTSSLQRLGVLPPDQISRRRLTLCGNDAFLRSTASKANGHSFINANKQTETAQEKKLESLKSVSRIPLKPPSSSSSTNSSRLLSISGALSVTKLKGFESKLQRVSSTGGDDLVQSLNTFGIGYQCKKGLKPESHHQDDFFITRFQDWGVYGVFDGHGLYGHQVANSVQKDILSFICDEFRPGMNYKSLLQRSFAHAEKSLQKQTSIYRTFDCSSSGTTATIILHLIQSNKLYIAWVGDSTCVLGRLSDDPSKRKYEALPLTQDHKPNNPKELKRIVAAGGQVQRLTGDIPYRVFFRHQLYPGLAMSRALGDTLGRKIGIIPEPEIVEYTIDPDRDICLCLSTDGVWEFMKFLDVMKLILQYGPSQVQEAAEKICSESWKRWIINEKTVVDDITTEIIYLNTHHDKMSIANYSSS